MKVTAFYGSLHVNGNTAILLRAAQASIAVAGIDTELIQAGDTTAARDVVFSQIEHATMVRTAEWKLVYHTDDVSELYRLTTDPGERENLFGRPEHCEIERDLLLNMVHVLGVYRREGFNLGKNGYFGC